MALTDLGNVIGPQGPQGPQGPTGATGATGATGPQGPPGPNLKTQTVSKSITITFNNVGFSVQTTIPITIPSGYTPILGRVSTSRWESVGIVTGFSSTAVEVTVSSSYPYNASGQTGPLDITVVVYYQSNS